jgi:UPF0755 protein
MKSFFRLLLILLIIAGGLAFFYLRTPYGPPSETFVDIPSGTSSTGIATRLEQSHIIRSRYIFLLERQMYGGILHAGVYRFDHPVKPFEVYARIVKGDVFTITLTIPEGFNLFDIAAAVQSAKLASSSDFLAAAHTNTALIADLSPHATSLEGFLFPDTYRFSPHVNAAQILTSMVKRFRQVGVQIGLLAPPGSIGDVSLYDVPQTVTLASLIEKEVHIDAERPVVAGVFRNRLHVGMPLATDPAVIYAALLDGRWRGAIYQSDLASGSPYNTYRHPGLPPGPIANPGVAALKAAMSPAQTDYLYFVANPDGTTSFSVDLKRHAAQVQSYRQSQKH